MDQIIEGTLVIAWIERRGILGIVERASRSRGKWMVRLSTGVSKVEEGDLMPLLLLPSEDRNLSPEEAYVKHLGEAIIALAEKLQNFKNTFAHPGERLCE